MDRSKVQVLRDIHKLNLRGAEWVKAESGHRLVAGKETVRSKYRAAAIANYLKWFGLLDYRGPRTGEFRVNEEGVAFLRGEISVPAYIKCRGGRVLRRSKKRVFLHEVKGVILSKKYWDTYSDHGQSYD